VRKVEALLLVGLVFVAGVLLLIADGATERVSNVAKPPPAVRWCPVSGGFTPEAYMLEFDLDWLNR